MASLRAFCNKATLEDQLFSTDSTKIIIYFQFYPLNIFIKSSFTKVLGYKTKKIASHTEPPGYLFTSLGIHFSIESTSFAKQWASKLVNRYYILLTNIVCKHTIHRETWAICLEPLLNKVIFLRKSRIREIIQRILEIMHNCQIMWSFSSTFLSATHDSLSSTLVKSLILEKPLGMYRATLYTKSKTDLLTKNSIISFYIKNIIPYGKMACCGEKHSVKK